MKESIKMRTYLKIILTAIAIIFSVSAYAVVRCGIDGHNMMWTGNTMVDLRTVVLLRCAPSTVLGRLAARGDNSWMEDELVEFDAAELDHARFVCTRLAIELAVLSEPDPDAFIAAVKNSLA